MTRNRQLANPEGKREKGVSATPSRRTPPIKLATLQNVRDELGRLYREARTGKVATQDATRLAFIIGQLRELIRDMDIERRIAALEALNGDRT